jgi:hypothetical protein
MSSQVEQEPKSRVEVNLPDRLEVDRDWVWDDLEAYLFKGFLHSSASMQESHFVFKTLNHLEFEMIDFMRPKKKAMDNRLHFQASFIAHSIFMVDGENMLLERPKHIRRLIKIIQKIPASHQKEILSNLEILSQNAQRLYPLVEVYAHEDRSRLKWLQIKNMPIHSSAATGVPGSEELGMNHCQATWVALNQMMDFRDESERDWNYAKFIGSCFNGKGVRSVDQQDKAQKDIDRQKLDEQRMKILHRYLNKIDGEEEDDIPDVVTLPDGRKAKVDKKFQAESYEELADQLSSALSEEKDYHDLVIEDAMRNIKKNKKNMEYNRLSLSSDESLNPDGGSSVLGDREKANKYVERINKLRTASAMRIRPNLESSDKND